MNWTVENAKLTGGAVSFFLLMANLAMANQKLVPYSQIAAYNEAFFRTKTLLAPYKSITVPIVPDTSVPIDVNGDGFLDLVVLFSKGNYLTHRNSRIFLNDGHGNFRDATTTVLPNGMPTLVVGRGTVADFNGDGRPDLFIADAGQDWAPWTGAPNRLFLSSGSNGFVNASGKLPNIVSATYGANVGDVDGDGDIDIVACEDNYPIYLNDGNGKFTAAYGRIHASENVGCAFVLGDMNGDGFPDLVTGHAHGGRSLVLFNDGTGNFYQTAASLIPHKIVNYEDYAVKVRIHDFNGDGRPDLLISEARETYHELMIILNTEAGFVEATNEYFLGGSKQFVDLGGTERTDIVDVNNDGYLDILNDLTVYLNDGSGRFKRIGKDFLPNRLKPDGTGAEGAAMMAVSFGDFDGDGRVDFIGYNNVYPGTWCGADCPGTKTFYQIFYAKDLPATQTGNAKPNSILGGPASETLSGLGGNDIIFAAAGNDKVFGGPGDDYLNGGKGNDVIDGGDGNDTLVGGPGNDTLIGGPGKDIFVFNAPLIAANVDTLPDFTPVDDKIHLDKNVFKGLPKGTLNAAAFALSSAQTMDTRVFYKKGLGELYFDADGPSGPMIPKLFARTKKGMALTNVHFVVY